MIKSENVKEQYSDDGNLSARISLHAKHSTNKQGLVPWLFEQYYFSQDIRILELGCGNADQWEGRVESLPKGVELILSDFSEGMVDIVSGKYVKETKVSCQRIDIQNIPFEDEAFDIVIANFMLYHVPDIDKALMEVKRVIKENGKFYAATNGNGELRSFVHKAIKKFKPDTQAFAHGFSFNLQNGQGILSKYFSNVERVDFEDSLAITNTEDLIDWIKSSVSIEECDVDFDELYDYFEDIRARDGVISIPKECGLFISKK
jgi:ubiquinone/menaquinone biosynthesis C-methylase UbiE